MKGRVPACRKLVVFCLQFLAYLFVSLLIIPLSGAHSLVEILYVQGCPKDSQPLRDTRDCFNQVDTLSAPLKLFIRGSNYPLVRDDQKEISFRVVLRESSPLPSLLQNFSIPLESHSGKRGTLFSEKMEFVCESAKASLLSPSELITCDLFHPNITLSARNFSFLEDKRKAWGSSLSESLAWFDLFIESDLHGIFETIGVLHHCVEINLSTGLRRRERGDQEGGGATVARLSKIDSESSPAYNSTKRLSTHVPNQTPLSDIDDVGEVDEHDVDLDAVLVELGIGGLKNELHTLFRRVCLLRLPSLNNLSAALGLQHVRGVILYGPPGNGKTLIARSLARLLGPGSKFSMVSAADILSVDVSETENYLRNLFEGATVSSPLQEGSGYERAQGSEQHRISSNRDHVTDNKAHVLVIDDFETLFHHRGYSLEEDPAHALHDDLTSILLSLMDSLNSQTNLLVVGLTSRLQDIDPALMRPGRFEVLVEIPSPDIVARKEIYFIHMAKLQELGFLSSHVDLNELAKRSDGFSGFNIANVVRSAISYALLRYRDSIRMARAKMASPLFFSVLSEDFDHALRDIRSSVDETDSLNYAAGEHDFDSAKELVDYDGMLKINTDRFREQVLQVSHSQHVFSSVVALTGTAGSGKTVVAQHLTSVFPFSMVRFLSCRSLAELSPHNERLQLIRNVFNIASRAQNAVVVLDDYDVLLESLSLFPLLVRTFENLLYEFMHHRGPISRSFGSNVLRHQMNAGMHNGSNIPYGNGVRAKHNRRFLILSSTSEGALPDVPYSLHLHLHPLSISGVQKLLRHYHLANDPKLIQSISKAYPVAMSYRNFLRLTDMALWSLKESMGKDNKANIQSAADAKAHRDNDDENVIQLPRFFRSENDEGGSNGEDKQKCLSAGSAEPIAECEGFFTLTTVGLAQKYTAAVGKAVGVMGLADPFAGWYNNSPEASEDMGGNEYAIGVAAGGEGIDILW